MTRRMRTAFSFFNSGLLLTAVANRNVTTDASLFLSLSHARTHARARTNTHTHTRYVSEPWDSAPQLRVLLHSSQLWVYTPVQNTNNNRTSNRSFWPGITSSSYRQNMCHVVKAVWNLFSSLRFLLHIRVIDPSSYLSITTCTKNKSRGQFLDTTATRTVRRGRGETWEILILWQSVSPVFSKSDWIISFQTLTRDRLLRPADKGAVNRQ